MHKVRMLAVAATLFCAVAIGAYYLFGGQMNLSFFFPAPTFYEPHHVNIPTLRPATPGPVLRAGPGASPVPRLRRARAHMPLKSDILLHTSPAPYVPVPINDVTPPPAPTYAPVTPLPIAQPQPNVQPPQPAAPVSGAATPSP